MKYLLIFLLFPVFCFGQMTDKEKRKFEDNYTGSNCQRIVFWANDFCIRKTCFGTYDTKKKGGWESHDANKCTCTRYGWDTIYFEQAKIDSKNLSDDIKLWGSGRYFSNEQIDSIIEREYKIIRKTKDYYVINTKQPCMIRDGKPYCDTVESIIYYETVRRCYENACYCLTWQ